MNLWRKRTLAVSIAFMAFSLVGCRQQMGRQPAYRPLQESTTFPDRRASRPVVEGTVPRGDLPIGPYHTGHKDANALAAAVLVGNPAPAGVMPASTDDYVDEIPIAPEALGNALRRGQERFNVFCAPCHDRTAGGKGMIVERGFTPPPSLHTDESRGYAHKKQKKLIRDASVGYYFEVITQGYGAMPSYRSQIPVADRWAIVAYIRALQASQNMPLAQVGDETARKQLEESRGKGQ